MNFEEKFDKIIDTIENNVKLKTVDLLKVLEKETGYPTRLIASVFTFVTDVTFDSYARERRLVAALAEYRNPLSEYTLTELALESGYSDQAAFSKAFKKLFGFTITETLRKPDDKLKVPKPLYLKNLLEDERTMTNAVTASKGFEKMMFGLPAEKFKKAEEASELQIVFGLSDEHSQQAFDLAEKHECELFDAFQFIENYYSLKNSYFKNKPTPEDLVPFLEELYFDKGISLSTCFELYKRFTAMSKTPNASIIGEAFIDFLYNQHFSFEETLHMVELFEVNNLSFDDEYDLLFEFIDSTSTLSEPIFNVYYEHYHEDMDWMYSTLTEEEIRGDTKYYSIHDLDNDHCFDYPTQFSEDDYATNHDFDDVEIDFADYDDRTFENEMVEQLDSEL